MKKFLLLLSVLALVGCIQATASDTVTVTNEISQALPPVPAGISVPKTTLHQSVPADVSDAINQISKIGTPSLSITQNHLHSASGDFSFFDEVTITAQVSGHPDLQLVDIVLTPDQKASADLDVPVLVDGSQLLSVFASGNVNLDFGLTVEGQPPTTGKLDLISTISMDVSLQISKSISDIGK